MNKISIIIPIYNVDKYLSACIESVVNQSYKNLEIILVNDGSTDSCSKICENYAAQDQRIKVIHKQNGGLSDARNEGLKKANGDFISFIDSDDLVSLDFYQILLKNIINYNADIVECDFYKFEINNELEAIKIEQNKNAEIYYTEKALEFLMKDFLKQVVWNKIYKKSVIKDIIFPVNKINEDEYFTYKTFGNANKIIKLSEKLYFYRQQHDSIMGAKYSLRRIDGLIALEERIFYMKKHFPTLENLAIETFCFGATYHFQQLYINQNLDPEKKIRKNIFSKIKMYNKPSVYLHWHWKDIVWYQLFILFPKLYMKLRDFMEIKAQKRINRIIS